MLKNTVSGVAVAMLVAACATEGVSVNTVVPARDVGASQLRNVAVVGFSGNDGEGFTAELESALANATLNGAAYFNVTDRQTVRGMTGTRGASAQDIAQIVSFGQSMGVDGVYFGDIAGIDFDSKSRSATKTKCVEYDGLFDCEKREEYRVTCYDQTATYSVVPKLVDVSTGSIVYSRPISKTQNYTYCSDQTPGETRDSLLSKARSEVIADIRNDVAPRNQMATVKLAEEATFESPDDQAMFDGAIAFAKEGRLDRSCGVFETMAESYPDYRPVIYNTAVCAETSGDFERAADIYYKLDASLVTPDADISNALKRTQEQLQNQQFIDD